MSDHSIAVVRLDPDTDAMPSRVQRIINWLSEAELSRPNPSHGLTQPSEWLSGPAWRTIVEPGPWLEHFEGTSNNGVDITNDRAAYHGVENDTAPMCPRCSTSMPDDVYGAYFKSWYEGEEPRILCQSCGWAGLGGDWAGEFSFVVGAPAVTFNNWPELTRTFIDRLRTELGGRTAIVRAHM